MKEIDIRFTVEDDVDPAHFIRDVGNNLAYVLEAVELKNTGFGHILPDKTTAQTFVMGGYRG